MQLIPILNVPLTFALYHTGNTCISLYLFRQYKAQGWMFMYKKVDDKNEQIQQLGDTTGQNGGIFQLVDIENRYMPLQYVLEGDYTSQYPSIIMAYNISPETIVTKYTVPLPKPEDTNKVVLNYRSGQEDQNNKYVHFLKAENCPGIIP